MPLFAIYYTFNNTRYVKWFNTKHSANYVHVYWVFELGYYSLDYEALGAWSRAQSES